jgi:hypothetical protein
MIFLPHGVDMQMQAFLRTIGANVAIARQFYLETLHTTEVAVQMQPHTYVVTMVTVCPWHPSVREANIYTLVEKADIEHAMPVVSWTS